MLGGASSGEDLSDLSRVRSRCISLSDVRRHRFTRDARRQQRDRTSSFPAAAAASSTATTSGFLRKPRRASRCRRRRSPLEGLWKCASPRGEPPSSSSSRSRARSDGKENSMHRPLRSGWSDARQGQLCSRRTGNARGDQRQGNRFTSSSVYFTFYVFA